MEQTPYTELEDMLELEDLDDEPIELDGLTLVPARRTTFRQDAYVMQICREIGIIEIIAAARNDHHEAPDIAASIIHRLYATFQVGDLLAGVLLIEGQKWDEASAERVRRAVAEVDDPEVKGRLIEVVNDCIMYFFLKGAASSPPSARSRKGKAAPAGEGSSTSEARKNGGDPDGPSTPPASGS